MSQTVFAKITPDTSDDPVTILKHIMCDDMRKVDQIIEKQLQSSVALIPKLAHHLFKAGGKRLRPLLTLASYRLFKDDQNKALELAAAVEFIHTATLLHDDVIDESNLRRGVPTANDLWGNQASVLVGDFLFARSFQLMIDANNVDVLKILADASASISEGEVLQLSLCHHLDVKVEDALRVIEAKTATLFAAACEVGALMATHKEHAACLHAYGLNLGMAFQIVDDILDYSADQAKLGKEVGNDFREGKVTLPIILSYPSCDSQEKEFLKRTLVEQHQTPNDLPKIFEILHKHNGLDKAFDMAETFGKKAIKALDGLPNHPIKTSLVKLVQFSLERQS